MNHLPPSPCKKNIILGSLKKISKIWGDIRKSSCTTGINDTQGLGGKLNHEKT
jgi:hypothetical protein